MTDNPATMSQVIRQRMDEANLNNAGLSSMSGVAANTIGNLLRGYVQNPDKPIKPSRDTIAKIAEALDIDRDRMFAAYGVEGPRFTRFDVTGLSPHQVERVRGYIDGLREK